MSGDGGLSMLLGDLITAVQENIPIKIAVFNNGSLGFVELEMKVEGLLDAYTPPKVELAQVFGTALYSAKAVLSGRASDVWELVTENLPKL